MLKLVISDDEGKTTVVPLARDEITIGRKEGNTIRLTERNVSRRHARLHRRQSEFVIEDLASYNGIVLNGARLAETRPVRHGDQILIGDYKLQIVDEPGTQVAPPTPTPTPAPPSEHHAPLIPASAPPSTPAAPASAPGLAALNDPFAPPQPGAGAATVPEHIRGLRVVFLAPAGVPAPVALDRLPIIMGRSEAADVALPFSSISREHARLFIEDDKLFIEDMGSSNGVQINGEKHKKVELAPGDMVQLGVVEFRIARRGDSTVVIRSTAEAEGTKGTKSNKGLVAGVVFGGLALGLALFIVFRSPPGPAAVPTPPAPNVVAPAPAPAPAPTPAPVAAPSTPEPTPVPAPEPPPAAAAPVPAAPATPEPSAPAAPEPAAPAATEPTAPAAAAAPVAQPLAAPSPTRRERPRDRTPSAAPSAPSRPEPTPPPNSGGGGMDAAQACLRSGGGQMNRCVVNALRSSASSEPELRLLCITYRQMGDRTNATSCMRRYVQRYPSTRYSDQFNEYITGE
jgi:ABC transport system ATP-binding/permease protein